MWCRGHGFVKGVNERRHDKMAVMACYTLTTAFRAAHSPLVAVVWNYTVQSLVLRSREVDASLSLLSFAGYLVATRMRRRVESSIDMVQREGIRA